MPSNSHGHPPNVVAGKAPPPTNTLNVFPTNPSRKSDFVVSPNCGECLTVNSLIFVSLKIFWKWMSVGVGIRGSLMILWMGMLQLRYINMGGIVMNMRFPTSLATLPNLQVMRLGSLLPGPAPDMRLAETSKTNRPVCEGATVYKEFEREGKRGGVGIVKCWRMGFLEVRVGTENAPWKARGTCCGWEAVPGYWVNLRNLQFIKCNNESRVTSVSFANYGLNTTVVPDLSGLLALERLDLGDNRFLRVDGGVFLGGVVESLKFLSISNNPIVGTLPSTFTNLKNLEVMYIDSSFTGPFPDLRNMTSLWRCHLDRIQTCIPFVNVEDFKMAQPLMCRRRREMVEMKGCSRGDEVYRFKPVVPAECKVLGDMFFGDANPPWYPSENCCGWYSRPVLSEFPQLVKCDGEGMVTHVAFWNMSLGGRVPDLGRLKRLTYLDLSMNAWNEVGEALEGVKETLKHLIIRDLIDARPLPFPATISKLTNLETLRIDPTFTGEMANLANLTGLTTCSVRNPTCLPTADKVGYLGTQPGVCVADLVEMEGCKEYGLRGCFILLDVNLGGIDRLVVDG
ncbi:hypothetical protein BC829DRAFT_423738 [Chytridium lagenaria]|nr:hypothetical protein BC829DRAFT_423738 [Chytridium lagenaria]